MVNLLLCGIISIYTLLSPSDDNYCRIHGTIASAINGHKAILEIINHNQETISFQESSIKNGSFFFKEKEFLDGLPRITILDKDNKPINSLRIITEQGELSVTIEEEEELSQLKGTPWNNLLQQFRDSSASYTTKIKAGLTEENTIGTSLTIKKDSPITRIYFENGRFQYQFFKDNLQNPVGQGLFFKDMENLSLYIYTVENKDSHSIKNLSLLLDESLRNHPRLVSYLAKKEEKKKAVSYEGTKIPDFEFQNLANEKVHLSQYIGKGNYTLIDIWASWCNPCIQSIPHLKKLYNNYHDKGFDIINISLDNDRKPWKKMVEKQEMPWLQLIELTGFQSAIAQTYDIKGIPFCILIDPEGNILTTSIFSVENILKEKF